MEPNAAIYAEAGAILRSLYGAGAAFRPGQYEAIEATMTHRRTLVVQRTGWGKSLVYFLCTKMLRRRNHGVSLVISPLLVLMDNQLEAAEKLGLQCAVLNSGVREQRESILRALRENRLDLLFITPESLFAQDVQQTLAVSSIGLFVIDEAHCISDWGHDFRLEYGKLKAVISRLPANVPILATTATANDRVVADLQEQLGEQVFVSRGPLSQDSLSIQVLPMLSKPERYAWLVEHVPRLPGSGILYCLTHRDCQELADFLQGNGIAAAAYYSRNGEEGDALNRQIEEDFRKDRLKVIVATVKLGMGYDKGNIAFVIHYQMPANIVSYYQQIGRAGRNIPNAYIVLMRGREDADIHNYFLETAFPTQRETEQIVADLGENGGSTISQLCARHNIRRGRLQKALDFLLNDGFLMKDGRGYYLTPKRYFYDSEHYDRITAIRRQEIRQMTQLYETDRCYSRYIVSCLDDHTAQNCGRCANCLGRPLLPVQTSGEALRLAQTYLDRLTIPIEPRKQWATSQVTKASRIRNGNRRGFCLCHYGDAGYGMLVKQGKYGLDGRFSTELVAGAVTALRPFVAEHEISHICPVPSLRSGIVSDLARRLSTGLGLRYVELLEKSNAQPQKDMENSAYQCANAWSSFHLRQGARVSGNVLLVDDIVDSGWTLTVCGYRLTEAGAEAVYPFALASSSNRE